MLFSNDQVAKFIDNNFEPVWVSVRPVPRVTIDFGNGHVVNRTLHGNVATYVCSSDGQVLDVLPGIYEPKTYVDRLAELRKLHQYVLQPSDLRPQMERLREYHLTQAAALKDGAPRHQFASVQPAVSIFATEGPARIVLQPARRLQARVAVASGDWQADDSLQTAIAKGDLSGWKALAEDTQANETIRRRQIHEHLAEIGKVDPDGLKKWLYKDILHADLDDPYLGLREVLFGNYPFTDEDAAP